MLLVALPYLARDLEAWVRTRRWPAWTAPAGARAGLAMGACVAMIPGGWIYPDLRPGLRIAPQFPPVAACDFIAAHGIRGRAFNQFEFGGYLLWRFWPDRTRLPFIDIHQTGTRQDRRDYVSASFDPQAWRELDARRRFDWALVKRYHAPEDSTLDILDADPGWTLVFADDAAALYLKRGGALAATADSFAYRVMTGGAARRNQVAAASYDDGALRARLETELARMAAASPQNSQTLSLMASLLMLDGRWADARAALEGAHRVDPGLPLYRERMGTIEASAPRLQQP